MGIIKQKHAQNVLRDMEQYGVKVNACGKKIDAFQEVNVHGFY